MCWYCDGKTCVRILADRIVCVTFVLAERQSSRYDWSNMDFGAHALIWIILVGLVIGAIAKLLMPGRDPGGCIVTILLGIAGAFVGTWIGQVFWGPGYAAGIPMSIVGALVLLLIYRLIFRARP